MQYSVDSKFFYGKKNWCPEYAFAIAISHDPRKNAARRKIKRPVCVCRVLDLFSPALYWYTRRLEKPNIRFLYPGCGSGLRFYGYGSDIREKYFSRSDPRVNPNPNLIINADPDPDLKQHIILLTKIQWYKLNILIKISISFWRGCLHQIPIRPRQNTGSKSDPKTRVGSPGLLYRAREEAFLSCAAHTGIIHAFARG